MGVVPTPTDQTIKRKSLVDQEIKSSFKAGSSDQEPILAIKNFDRRRRWKYRAHCCDYPLQLQSRWEPTITKVVQADLECYRKVFLVTDIAVGKLK